MSRRKFLAELTAPELAELIAADNIGLIPDVTLRPITQPQDMQATYESHRDAYGTHGSNRRGPPR
jgi:hypothetical protein